MDRDRRDHADPWHVGVLRRKEPKRKSIALTLMRDVQGSAVEKLRMRRCGLRAVLPTSIPLILRKQRGCSVSLPRWRRGAKREEDGHERDELCTLADAADLINEVRSAHGEGRPARGLSIRHSIRSAQRPGLCAS
jgi:hypothetical protein